MKKGLLILPLLIVIQVHLFAQSDAQFSQYMFNGIYINPAYAGYREQLNMHMFFRSQWTGGLEGNPETFTFALDAIANNNNVGLALSVIGDKLGAESTLAGYLNYAYRLRVSETGRLAFGLGIGIAQYSIDGSLLDPNNPTDPSVPLTKQSVVVPDLRAGLFYTTDRFYGGLSADNIISQYMSYTKDPSILVPTKYPNIYLTAGCLIPLNKSLLLKPSALFKVEKNAPSTLDINTFLMLYDRLWIGASYRTGVMFLGRDNLQSDLSMNNAIAALIEVYATDRLRIGYAYDFSLSEFKNYNYGTHEISLGYSFIPKKIRMLTPRYF
ncbi:type IX secretion system membrane protein PorP/SprF [Solitalea sp. MAHUQ-68]|uniref:Type IX secretion system membrane protein PorP/SprF n=1 Tax=Solitalea agri TaxID=2953739 RepID=A0A9X2JDX3_9SPHI|nr:type IX secretion system membrane protein PorP/SprF [Solitalea agri]MCO4294114.1 type IX secretion system membrane protein PorP/SprF [Solitalea agri]